MKYTLISLFAVLLMSCGGSNLETFVSKKDGFEIGYPADWDTTRLDLRMAFMAAEPSDSASEFTEGYSISVFNSEGRGLKNIVNENVEMAQLYYPDANIEQEDFTNGNDVEMVKLVLTYEAMELKLINYAYFMMKNDKLYTLTQIVEQSKSGDYVGLFEEIINSFDWID